MREVYDMQAYVLVRVLEVRAGQSTQELEALARSGLLEMQRWIEGVEQVSLVHLGGEPARYTLTMNFRDREAYIGWRRVEEEGADYWERYASVQLHWDELCREVQRWEGEQVFAERIASETG
jgi:hypothetical protein